MTMPYDRVAISSGHGALVRGASGILDEVDEARRVVEDVADKLAARGVDVVTFHDDVSTSQGENLDRIVSWHNQQDRELDVSVHFNAYVETTDPMGTEVLYVTQAALAGELSTAIADAGDLIDRGAKERNDLAFLNGTDMPAVLIETCFVDSTADAELYEANFDVICEAIAQVLGGAPQFAERPPAEPPAESERPPGGRPVPPAPDHPTVAEGDKGPAVASVQTSLGVPADGDFGSVTDGAVRGYQAAYGLQADGVVGPNTWDALDALDAAKAGGDDGLTAEQIADIVQIAETSEIAKYDWNDRGTAPPGYTAGIALCFALAAKWLDDRSPPAELMAQADREDEDEDALSWYAEQFDEIEMDNTEDGLDTLRGLFVLLLGLGMRESSGRYCEGRDMSADNVSADTAEAGMFQTSWNIRSCCKEIPPLLDAYWRDPNGFLDVFDNGVSPDGNDLGNYGSGDGAKYQFLSKFAPAFHVMVTALGLRYLRQHWGPINRSEVELRPEADDMLRRVQLYLGFGSAEV